MDYVVNAHWNGQAGAWRAVSDDIQGLRVDAETRPDLVTEVFKRAPRHIAPSSTDQMVTIRVVAEASKDVLVVASD